MAIRQRDSVVATPHNTCTVSKIRHGGGYGAPATGSTGSHGSTGSTGIEDEDEDEKAPRSPPGSAGPFSWGRTSVSGDRDSLGHGVGDKVWGQGVRSRCEDKVCHRAAEGQRSAFTL